MFHTVLVLLTGFLPHEAGLTPISQMQKRRLEQFRRLNLGLKLPSGRAWLGLWPVASRANAVNYNAGPSPGAAVFTEVSGQAHGSPNSPLSCSGDLSTPMPKGLYILYRRESPGPLDPQKDRASKEF